ncbi:unnamed protein product [Ectocarpus fasciculatus]
MMRFQRASVLFLLSSVGAHAADEASCVPLSGIVTGGHSATNTLNLDEIKVSMSVEMFHLSNPVIPAVAACSTGLEATITMRALLAVETSAWSVASAFQPAPWLNIFGDEKTTAERRRCQDNMDEDQALLFLLHYRVAEMYAFAELALKSMPFCRDAMEPLMAARGHPLSFLEDGDDENIDTSTPWGLGRAYANEMWDYLAANDGWNSDGSLGGKEFNRIPFSGDFTLTDSQGNAWTPYIPCNTPYKLTHKSYWQPLLESNGYGYLSTQEHVTPHIGSTGRYYGFNSEDDERAFASRTVADPGYRYYEAVPDVIEASLFTASSPYRQFAVSFFDSKFGSLIPLKIAYFLRDETKKHYTETDFYQVTLEVQLALYNSVLLVWKEKVRHDKPRPPSMVRHKLGDKLVKAYGGPGKGVQVMKASEWEPFIRTMPHSEFPSGSACLCEAFARQIKNFFGTDEIDPPLQFPPGAPPAGFTSAPLEFSSWSEIAEVCGDSRVWGGMHFRDSVPAGAELCGSQGMVDSIHESLERLKAGDTSAAVFKKDVGELMVRPTERVTI